MSILDIAFRSVTCNVCEKTVTFEQTRDEGGLKAVIEEHPWLKTARVVQQVFGGRNFLYCSDLCELKAVELGFHNPEEHKKIVLPQGANTMAHAAAAAKAAEIATEKIKAGAGVTLHGG